MTLINSSPRRIAIYIRVSTQEQKIEGYSPEGQRNRLLAYVEECKSRNYVTKPEWIFEDVHTGKDMNRPQLQKLMKAVKKGRFDGVLVWKIDRISRTLKHLLAIFEEFEKNEVSFLSLNENIDFSGPIGRLVFQMFGAIAQFERELIKGRTRMGKITSAEMGNYTGTQIPYGYKPVSNPSGKGKKLEIVPEEKKWVEQMYQWHVYEDLGYLQIKNRLNELKVPKGQYAREISRQAPWTERIVADVLTNPLYRGTYVANKKDENSKPLPPEEWTIVNVPACVSEFTFEQAKEARCNRHNGPRTMDYILSGKLFDMTLERPRRFSGMKRSKGGISYRRVQFTDRNTVYHPVFEVPGKQLEEYVWEKISEAMNDPESFIKYYFSKEYSDPNEADQLEAQLDILRKRKTTIETVEIGRIEFAYERCIYDEDKLQEKLTAKELELNDVNEKITAFEDRLAMMGRAAQEISKLREASEAVKYKIDKLSRDQKKILCQLFVDRVEMFRDRKKDEKRWNITAEIFFRFNPQGVRPETVVGRTPESQQEAVSDDSEAENGLSGGKGVGSYTLFNFKLFFKSDLSRVILEEIG